MIGMLTEAQREALTWLREHSGDGLFDKDGVLMAAGERAPFMRSTWNGLAQLGLVEFYSPAGKGRGRLKITDAAKSIGSASAEALAMRQASMAPHPTDDDYPENAAG